jgi:hypothetical protein
MHRLINKKNNLIVTAKATLFKLAIIVVVDDVTTITLDTFRTKLTVRRRIHIPNYQLKERTKSSMEVPQDGNNVYIIWWTNKSGN